MGKMRGHARMCLFRIEQSEPRLLSKEVRAGAGGERIKATKPDLHHLAEMKDDGPPVAQHVSHVGAQNFDLASGKDASFAGHDGDASDFAGFQ